MTIIWGQGIGEAGKSLTLVREAIQSKDGEEALRLCTSSFFVPFKERGLGTLQQIILNCPNPKLIEAVMNKLNLRRIDEIDSSGDNALMTAVKCKDLAAINLLVAAKADVNLSDALKQTPLYQAVNRPSLLT